MPCRMIKLYRRFEGTDSLPLKEESPRRFEILVNICQSTWRNSSNDSKIQQYCSCNFTSCIKSTLFVYVYISELIRHLNLSEIFFTI
jgi:hypothetical protein